MWTLLLNSCYLVLWSSEQTPRSPWFVHVVCTCSHIRFRGFCINSTSFCFKFIWHPVFWSQVCRKEMRCIFKEIDDLLVSEFCKKTFPLQQIRNFYYSKFMAQCPRLEPQINSVSGKSNKSFFFVCLKLYHFKKYWNFMEFLAIPK